MSSTQRTCTVFVRILTALGGTLATSPAIVHADPVPSAPPPKPLTVCLAVAADDSPIYPLTELPANHRGFWMVVRLPDGATTKRIAYLWSAVDVAGVAPDKTKVIEGDEPVHDGKAAPLHFQLPRDVPLGKYRIDVSTDGKPFSSVELTAVASPPVKGRGKPEDLLPLAPDTRWTYEFVATTGPIVEKFALPGTEKAPDGTWHATASYRVVSAAADGVQVEIRRNDVLVDTQWWRLDPKGLFLLRDKTPEDDTTIDPPFPILHLPLAGRVEWKWTPKGAPGASFHAWGPLPVHGLSGPVPGWVVVYERTSGLFSSTVERHFVPGVGLVHESTVNTINGKLSTRLDADLVANPAASGSR